jgi:hypothetical protein
MNILHFVGKVTCVHVFCQELTDNYLPFPIAFCTSLRAGVLFLHFVILLYNFDIQYLTQARFINSYFGGAPFEIRSGHF